MPDVKFFAVLPTNASTSDRVTRLSVSGNLLQDPQQFSVNFVNSPDCTDNITYHFKVVIPTQTIIENYKRNGEWSSLHQEKYLNIFDESSFCLEFAFDYANSMMRVYQGRDSGHNFITEYETLFSLSDIQAVQVWGDVQKVNQFALSYN
ncbi:uncharacterized protein LOC6616899 isoform X2 [Drosophila sechellia]|uniref:Galectin n=3 Tax=melanogaster subgroup TaxID=32351 RepID=B4QX47_DROSI|nr:uncharacterized protein LOC6616899 isoform X2 [Drosophila sechellia]XP_016034424.1 uncharacterized protein LOC6727839 isoform X2 [Drosophila simulans]XP_033167561.1 uncharacterized protein LOC117145851 isoform X2 [Drosophila mauritiana]EDW44881.1 GM15443 [Drosophila sechellia]EDX12701.1 GD20298 [Drosophila simulans]KMZ03197.1 uncharacterized protein Dsimw501_GD20298, isoform A [Drosophila simulans]